MTATPMRVLAVGSMYPPHYLGGQEIIWRHATLHQRDAGHEVRVLTTGYRRDGVPEGSELDDDVHRELRWYWHDHGWPELGLRGQLELERHNARVLDRHLAELEPDAVLWWAMGGMSLSLVERVRRAGIPALGMACDDWMLYGPDRDRWTRRFAGRPGLARLGELAGIPTRFHPGPSARWLFLSEYSRRRALTRWELPDSGVAHAGVDGGRFPTAPERPWAWRLAYIGRLDPRKGIDIAVRALPLLPAEAHLAIVGGGDEGHRRELEGLVDQLGLRERVSFSERPHAELAAAYADADALLFPVTWEEPWGLVPLEAMAVGRPVVATGRGGSGEYLADGENCLVFDPDQGPEAVAAAIHRMASDDALRARLRAGGLATARRLGERACNDALLAELETMARTRRPGVDNAAA
ncbi:MAG: glycosyltransferase [Thermoleophilaceae bacterium]